MSIHQYTAKNRLNWEAHVGSAFLGGKGPNPGNAPYGYEGFKLTQWYTPSPEDFPDFLNRARRPHGPQVQIACFYTTEVNSRGSGAVTGDGTCRGTMDPAQCTLVRLLSSAQSSLADVEVGGDTVIASSASQTIFQSRWSLQDLNAAIEDALVEDVEAHKASLEGECKQVQHLKSRMVPVNACLNLCDYRTLGARSTGDSTTTMTSPTGLCTRKLTGRNITRSARMLRNASGSIRMERNIYSSSEQRNQSRDGPFCLI
ncbi:hypothetical protein BDQ12DRAFT_668691 [Crucibulum laeve]|uniref:Uncharacterized protein n=1 Tax=Crucibulum laeve TaxID=68775 RepID=A0A5C3LQQ5_9AGAR|nr:hypothetical protein BDQ12DRAFT_668691 [Crucibulum laeve]